MGKSGDCGSRRSKTIIDVHVLLGLSSDLVYEAYTKPMLRHGLRIPDAVTGAIGRTGVCVWTRETSLLYDEKFYGPLNKERVAEVVAHELAHQWFGNLVTLKWWDNLWLNEGFAAFVEYSGADEISDHNMRMMDFFLIRAYARGLAADAVASSHPLSFKIEKAEEVSEAFDDITYSKGASVLTMLSATVGEDNFKKAITHYLKKFSYGNARAKDLWQAFDETVTDVTGPKGGPIKITEFAPQWTTQMGFPMVTVKALNDTTVKITQERYKANKNAVEPEKYRHPKYG
ncbi:peptidase family M1 [Ostertagia ostertagi]